MPKIRTFGVPGSAVLLGTAGLYLAYVGVKDVPFFQGLRSILQKERPTPRQVHSAYTPQTSNITLSRAAGSSPPGLTLGLVGNALNALPTWRAMFPGMTMYGLADRPDNPTSDHPKGKAIDLMTSDPAVAQQIIQKFVTQPGAHYWIWNRRIGNIQFLWLPRNYSGDSPHTDHVHLSYY